VVASDYIIPINGMEDGSHLFLFKIDGTFPLIDGNTDILNCNINIEVNFHKQSKIIEVDFITSGTIKCECDVCLDEVEIEISSSNTIFFNIEGNKTEFEDEILIIAEDETEIDFSPFLYEQILFSLPLKRVHGTDKDGNSLCNSEMLAKLSRYIIKDENPIDPRWKELSKLINN